MDTTINEQTKKILKIDVLHLDAVGYGPRGEHTRTAWRNECIRNLLTNKYEFTKWQEFILSKVNGDVPEVSFECAILYSDGDKDLRGKKQTPYALDFVGEFFNYKLNCTNYNFLLPAIFSYATFNDEILFRYIKFESVALFIGTKFNGRTTFLDVDFKDETNFTKASFKKVTQLENNVFHKDAFFSNSTFNEKVIFDGTKFEIKANFNYSTFNNDTSFKKVTFLDDADFERIKANANVKFTANFEKNAIFRHAKFNGIVSFGSCTFNGNVIFFKTHFDNRCNFEPYFDKKTRLYRESTIFKREINFENAYIGNIVNFERVIFEGEVPSFLGVDNANARLFFSNESSFIKSPISEVSIKYYAQLKRLSDEQGQADQALMFNALELRAKAKLPSASFGARFVTFLYKHISDFGRSFVRPMIGYLLLLVLSSILVMSYSTCYERPVEDKQVLCNSTKDQLQLKLSYERAVFEYAMFRAGGLMDFTDTGKQNNAVNCRLFEEPIEPPLMRAWGIFKGIASIALLFLAALGLRNKYRIK